MILYLANVRLPSERAHGVQIMKMCEAFARAKQKVELVVPKRRTRITEDPFSYYAVEPLFTITRLPTFDTVRLGYLGFWLQSLVFALAAFRYCRAHEASWIYSRDELPLFLLSMAGIKNLVWEAHMPRYNLLARALLRRAAKIVVISQGLKDFYAAKGVPEERLLVAHDGVDLQQFGTGVEKAEARRALSLPDDLSIVMYLGRLDRWKGVKTLLEASHLLPEARVVVVGEGEEYEEFKKEYRNVTFLGSLPYRDLPRNQRAADVLVVPNSGRSEISRLYTSPLKVFAHMAGGVPIVASNLPSLREVLNERSAYLFEADNKESLARAVRRALTESGSMERARQAQEDVRRYSWENRAKDILQYVEG